MISVNDVSLSTYGVTVEFDSTESQSPEIRTNFEKRGVYGSINYGATHGNADFKFPCMIKGDYRTNIKEIQKMFLDANGNYKEVKFKYDKWSNRYYNVMLTKPLELIPVSTNFATFDLEVTAPTPFGQSIYATEQYFGTLNLVTNGPLEIPINYYGTFRTGFSLSLFGSLSNFDVEVHFLGGIIKTFKYVSTAHSTYFVCDFNEFTIDDNGTNGLANASGDYPYLNRETTKIVLKGDMTGSLNLNYREIYV